MCLSLLRWAPGVVASLLCLTLRRAYQLIPRYFRDHSLVQRIDHASLEIFLCRVRQGVCSLGYRKWDKAAARQAVKHSLHFPWCLWPRLHSWGWHLSRRNLSFVMGPQQGLEPVGWMLKGYWWNSLDCSLVFSEYCLWKRSYLPSSLCSADLGLMIFYIYELPAKDHYIVCLEHSLFGKKFQIVNLIGEGPQRLHLLPGLSTANSCLNVHRYTLSLGIKRPPGCPSSISG